jgi:hypothetical protein
LAATSAKLANYVGDRGGKLAWRQYAPNWKITMALDNLTLIPAILFGNFMFFIYFPMSFMKRYRECKKERLIRFAIYVSAALIPIALNAESNALAFKRSNQLIAAVEAYTGKYGAYPERLQQLQPEFINKIPSKARISFFDSGFRYSATKDSHTLMYVYLPPYGRKTYNFEQKSWGTID